MVSITLTFFFYCLQQGDRNLENVTHEEAVATLKATHERVVLLVGKLENAYLPPPSPVHANESHTPPPLCEYTPQLKHLLIVFLRETLRS